MRRFWRCVREQSRASASCPHIRSHPATSVQSTHHLPRSQARTPLTCHAANRTHHALSLIQIFQPSSQSSSPSSIRGPAHQRSLQPLSHAHTHTSALPHCISLHHAIQSLTLSPLPSQVLQLSLGVRGRSARAPLRIAPLRA